MTPHKNLAELIAAIASDKRIPIRRRICCRSCLRLLARCLRLSPDQVPVSAGYFRRQIPNLTPAKTKLPQKRLDGIWAALGFAFASAGIGEGRRPRGKTITIEFANLLNTANNQWNKWNLRRLFAFCSERHIGALAINDDVLREFRDHLVRKTLVRDPVTIVRLTRVAWNKCCAKSDSWPKVILKFKRVRAFPVGVEQAFWRDLEDYRQFLRGRLVHPLTQEFIIVALQETAIKQHLGAIIRNGGIIAELGRQVQSIDDIVNVDAINAIEKRLIYQQPPLSAGYIRHEMLELGLAARRWSRRQVKAKQRLRASSNRALISSSHTKFQQIQDLLETGSLSRLLGLPTQLMEVALARDVRGARELSLAQAAVGLEIMIMVPIDLAQIARLRTGIETVQDSREQGGLTLIFRANSDPVRTLEYDLPARSSRLIRTYRENFFITQPEGKWLLPGKTTGHRNVVSLSATISKNIFRHVGVKMTPRAIRFLSATVYLQQHENGYEVIRRAMGHASISHTIRMFRNVRMKNAFDLYDALLVERTDAQI